MHFVKVQIQIQIQKVSGLMIPPVGPIETLKILDFLWSRRRWLGRVLRYLRSVLWTL